MTDSTLLQVPLDAKLFARLDAQRVRYGMPATEIARRALADTLTKMEDGEPLLAPAVNGEAGQ